MRDSIYRFTLDMHDISSQVQITVKKNDNARRIHVNLMENGRPFTIEPGCRAVIEIKKPDGNILFNDCDIVDSGNCISYDFTSQTATADGLCECEVRVFDSDNNVITSPRFTMLVTEQVYDEGQVESQSEFTSLVSTLSKALKLEEEAEQIYSYIDTKKGESVSYTDEKVAGLNSRIDSETADLANKIDTQDAALQKNIDDQYNDLVRKIDEQDADLAAKIDAQDNILQKNIDDQKTAIEKKIDDQDAALESKINSNYSALYKKIDDQDSVIRNDINAKYNALDSGLRNAVTKIEDKQDKLKQGDNIIIEADGTISAVMTSGTGEEAFDIVYANVSGYGEVGTWADGNPDGEDRMYRFVTVDDNNVISIANDTDQIFGVVTNTTGFVTNAKNYDPKDSSKSVVALIGIVPVKTEDLTIVAGDKVMSDSNGYAVRSTNDFGYRVLGVISEGVVSIALYPNTDAIQRLKTEIDKVAVIINDEASSANSVYSSNKVNELLNGLKSETNSAISAIINDTTESANSAYSSHKVNALISTLDEELRTVIGNIINDQTASSSSSYSSQKVDTLLGNLSSSLREYADAINNNLGGSISNLSESVDARFSQANDGLAAANANIAAKQNKPSTASYTLLSANWNGTESPYSYDLSNGYPDTAYDIDVLVNMETITAEQRDALINANIVGGTSNKLYAMGEKPTIDIPVVLEVVSK